MNAMPEGATDDIDFVAAARAMLDLPQRAGRGVQRQALHVAMAVAPDFGLGARLPDEGIVVRRLAVGGDADQLADVVAEILRLVAIGEMIAKADEQIAVGGLRHAAAIVIAGGGRPFLAEDHFGLFERAVAEARPRHRGAAAAFHLIGIAQEDSPALGEAAVDDDIEQPALARRPDLRHPGQRRRQLAVLADKAQPAGPFGHQHAAVGQEGESPGIDEAARDGLDFQRSGGGRKCLGGCGRGDGCNDKRCNMSDETHASLGTR
jgi:hypothetical protein